MNAGKAKKLFPMDPVIEISVEERKNIKKLESAIVELIWGGKFTQGEGAIVSNVRHKELLDNSLRSVVSVRRLIEEGEPPEIVVVDLKEAITALGFMIGKSVSEDILDRIFEQFCIGK